MQTSSRKVVNYVRRSYGDPEYDALLTQFENDHPAQFERWREVEEKAFRDRIGLCAYPDREWMNFCLSFLQSRLIRDGDGFGPFRAWRALRGRILRRLFDETPSLNPAPGAILVTEPRTMTDDELAVIVDLFRHDQPEIWSEWERIENGKGRDEDDPLQRASIAFYGFVAANCWVQSSSAITGIFVDVRALFWAAYRRTLAWN